MQYNKGTGAHLPKEGAGPTPAEPYPRHLLECVPVLYHMSPFLTAGDLGRLCCCCRLLQQHKQQNGGLLFSALEDALAKLLPNHRARVDLWLEFADASSLWGCPPLRLKGLSPQTQSRQQSPAAEALSSGGAAAGGVAESRASSVSPVSPSCWGCCCCVALGSALLAAYVSVAGSGGLAASQRVLLHQVPLLQCCVCRVLLQQQQQRSSRGPYPCSIFYRSACRSSCHSGQEEAATGRAGPSGDDPLSGRHRANLLQSPSAFSKATASVFAAACVILSSLAALLEADCSRSKNSNHNGSTSNIHSSNRKGFILLSESRGSRHSVSCCKTYYSSRSSSCC